MRKRVLRALGYALVASLALSFITVGIAAAWLRSDGGHRFLRDKTVAWVNARMKGRLEVDRVTGPVIGRVRFEGLRLLDPKGHEVAHCDSVEARFELVRAIRSGTIDVLTVTGPHADLGPFVDGRLGLDPLLEAFKQAEKLDLRHFIFHGGHLALSGEAGPFRVIAPFELESELRMADHGKRTHFDITRFAGHVRLEHGPAWPFAIAGLFESTPEVPLLLRDLRAHLDHSELVGHARLTSRRVDVEVKKLHVTARDFHQAVPLEDPPADIDATLSLHGLRTHAALALDLHPGEGSVKAVGHADLRRMAVDAHIVHKDLDGAFFPTRPPFVLDAIVDLSVRKTDKGIEGTTELTDGHGVAATVGFERAHVNCNWIGDGVHFGRIVADGPGAAITGEGTIHFKGDIDLHAKANVTDLGRFIGMARGKFELPGTPKDRGIVSAEIHLTKAPKEKPKFSVGHFGIAKKVTPELSQHPGKDAKKK